MSRRIISLKHWSNREQFKFVCNCIRSQGLAMWTHWSVTIVFDPLITNILLLLYLLGILSSDTVANVAIAGVTLAENHIGISLNYFRNAEDAFAGVIASKIIGSLQERGCKDYTDSSWAQVCQV